MSVFLTCFGWIINERKLEDIKLKFLSALRWSKTVVWTGWSWDTPRGATSLARATRWLLYHHGYKSTGFISNYIKCIILILNTVINSQQVADWLHLCCFSCVSSLVRRPHTLWRTVSVWSPALVRSWTNERPASQRRSSTLRPNSSQVHSPPSRSLITWVWNPGAFVSPCRVELTKRMLKLTFQGMFELQSDLRNTSLFLITRLFSQTMLKTGAKSCWPTNPCGPLAPARLPPHSR